MSTQPTKLSAHQAQIVDALADDYESLDQIRELVNVSVSPETLERELWRLVKLGFVSCHAPSATGLKRVPQPQRERLHAYWFALTAKGGRQLASMN